MPFKILWIEAALIGPRFGPPEWDLLFNCFLDLLWPEDVRVIAYTNDALLLVGGNTCCKLEEIAVVCRQSGNGLGHPLGNAV